MIYLDTKETKYFIIFLGIAYHCVDFHFHRFMSWNELEEEPSKDGECPGCQELLIEDTSFQPEDRLSDQQIAYFSAALLGPARLLVIFAIRDWRVLGHSRQQSSTICISNKDHSRTFKSSLQNLFFPT